MLFAPIQTPSETSQDAPLRRGSFACGGVHLLTDTCQRPGGAGASPQLRPGPRGLTASRPAASAPSPARAPPPKRSHGGRSPSAPCSSRTPPAPRPVLGAHAPRRAAVRLGPPPAPQPRRPRCRPPAPPRCCLRAQARQGRRVSPTRTWSQGRARPAPRAHLRRRPRRPLSASCSPASRCSDASAACGAAAAASPSTPRPAWSPPAPVAAAAAAAPGPGTAAARAARGHGRPPRPPPRPPRAPCTARRGRAPCRRPHAAPAPRCCRPARRDDGGGGAGAVRRDPARSGDVRGAPGGGVECQGFAWGCGMEPDGRGDARRALGRLLEAVLASRGEANAVFDILAVLQVGRAAVGRARWVLRADAGTPSKAGFGTVPGVFSRLAGLPGGGSRRERGGGAVGLESPWRKRAGPQPSAWRGALRSASPRSLRTRRRSRTRCAHAAAFLGPCWSGKSCLWDSCPLRRPSWQVSA